MQAGNISSRNSPQINPEEIRQVLNEGFENVRQGVDFYVSNGIHLTQRIHKLFFDAVDAGHKLYTGVSSLFSKVVCYIKDSFSAISMRLLVPAAYTMHTQEEVQLARQKLATYAQRANVDVVYDRKINEAQHAVESCQLVYKDGSVTDGKWIIYLPDSTEHIDTNVEKLMTIQQQLKRNVLAASYPHMAINQQELINFAQTLVATLVHKGVDPSEIAIYGKGFGALLGCEISWQNQGIMQVISEDGEGSVQRRVYERMPVLKKLFQKFLEKLGWTLDCQTLLPNIQKKVVILENSTLKQPNAYKKTSLLSTYQSLLNKQIQVPQNHIVETQLKTETDYLIAYNTQVRPHLI